MKITVFHDHVKEACKQNDLKLEEIAPILTAEGIEGVEFSGWDLINLFMPDHLASLGIPVSSVYEFFDWGNHPHDRSYKYLIQGLTLCHLDQALIVPGMVPEGKDWEKYRERMVKVLTKVCRIAKKRGISVRIEDFDDSRAPYARAEEVAWFLDRIPDLSCAFDTGNFMYSGENAMEALSLLRGRISYVHCKDRSLTGRAGEIGKETPDGRILYSAPVGSGIVGMEELVRELLISGYRGTFAIEHFGSPTMLEDIIASARFLKRCFKMYAPDEATGNT